MIRFVVNEVKMLIELYVVGKRIEENIEDEDRSVLWGGREWGGGGGVGVGGVWCGAGRGWEGGVEGGG